MFILRKINVSKGIETNINLGNRYDLITKEHNPEEFEKTSKELYDGVEPIVYGFIIYNDGTNVEDLCCHYYNYLMTGDGKTFANLSLK